MALPQPGVALSASMINVELTRAATALFSMNGTNERDLAGRPTANSTISFNDFYGKSFAVDGGYVPGVNEYHFMNFASEAFSTISISGSPALWWTDGGNFGAPNKSAGYVLSTGFSPIRFAKIAFVTNTPSQITTVSIDAGWHAGVYADSSKGYFSRGTTALTAGGDTHRDGYRVNLSNETLTFLGNLFPSNFHGSVSLSRLGVSGYFGRRSLIGTSTAFFFKLIYSNETTSTLTTIQIHMTSPVGWSNSPTAGYTYSRRSRAHHYRKLTYSNDTTSVLTAAPSNPGVSGGFAFSYVGVTGYVSGSGSNLNKLAYSNETWSTTTTSVGGSQGFSTFL